MSQNRLSSLAILSIENETARNLDLNTIISLFTNQKARKVDFFQQRNNYKLVNKYLIVL